MFLSVFRHDYLVIFFLPCSMSALWEMHAFQQDTTKTLAVRARPGTGFQEQVFFLALSMGMCSLSNLSIRILLVKNEELNDTPIV